MKLHSQLEDGNVLLEATQDEALLLGCLEDAWERKTDGGDEPPGSFWHRNVQLSPAIQAVAAFTELLARMNGIRLVFEDLDKMVRDKEPPKLYDISSWRVWVLRFFWFAVGALVVGVAQALA